MKLRDGNLLMPLDQFIASLLAGKSVLATSQMSAGELASTALPLLSGTRTRVLRAQPSLHLQSFMRQMAPSGLRAGDEGLRQGFNLLTVLDPECDRVVLLVQDAHLLPPATARYIALALDTAPHLGVGLIGHLGFEATLAAPAFASLNRHVTTRMELAVPRQLVLPIPTTGQRRIAPMALAVSGVAVAGFALFLAMRAAPHGPVPVSVPQMEAALNVLMDTPVPQPVAPPPSAGMMERQAAADIPALEPLTAQPPAATPPLAATPESPPAPTALILVTSASNEASRQETPAPRAEPPATPPTAMIEADPAPAGPALALATPGITLPPTPEPAAPEERAMPQPAEAAQDVAPPLVVSKSLPQVGQAFPKAGDKAHVAANPQPKPAIQAAPVVTETLLPPPPVPSAIVASVETPRLPPVARSVPRSQTVPVTDRSSGGLGGTGGGVGSGSGDSRRCRDIVIRAQLGEELTNGDKTFLRNGCR